MNVYLIRTLGFNPEDYSACIELLKSFNGPLQIIDWPDPVIYACGSESMVPESYPHELRAKKLALIIENERRSGASWYGLISICTRFRIEQRISENDFVFLLTEKKNEHNWFSVFDDHRNAFIDCSDWEMITNAPSKYPIAYEIVANVLRSLMKIKMIFPNPNVHDNAIGCMNDFCADKKSIMLKLRTADICEACLGKLRQEHVKEPILDQAFQIFEGIRTQLLFRKGAVRLTRLSEIFLSDRNKLYFTGLGNLELDLYPLYKTLYVFYLNHLEGVRLNELSDHREELLFWYRKFSVADSNNLIESRVSELLDPFSGSFSQKKSHLNRKIKMLLGEDMSAHYQITGEPGGRFKVNLAPHLIVFPDDVAGRYA